MKKPLLVCFLLLGGLMAQAQSSNKKAQKAFERGVEAIDQNPTQALKLFHEALSYDSTFAEAHLKLGQLYDRNLERKNVLFHYERAVELRPNEPAFSTAMLLLANQYLRQGNYAKAEKYYVQYIAVSTKETMQLRRAKMQVAKCQFAQKTLQNPLPINLKPLGKTLNTNGFQSFPVFTADQETFVMTDLSAGQEDLKASYRKEGVWSKPESLSPNINTEQNEGTCSLSADGRTLVFTSCNRRDGVGSCDLYISKKTGNEWSKAQSMGRGVNTTWWESQPSLSADGRMLYFSSERPGGVGAKDLWLSRLDSLGQWSKPENLGKGINTPLDDISPLIHANGTTLFFSSEGHLGMGGQDFHMSQYENGTWSTPENLGYPLNTHEDQVGLYITADGKKGYFTSDNKAEGFHENSYEPNRRLLIYEFDVPPNIGQKFKKTQYLKGAVYDAQTKQKVSANIELFSLSTGQRVSVFQSDSQTGQYTTVLPEGGQYAVYIDAKGYFFKSLSFDFSQQTNTEGKILDVYLEGIKKDSREVLNNIFFESGKFELSPKSGVELQKILQLLRQNPALKIEISGHTDDVGKEADNLRLSQSRAKSVGDFLLKNGINPSQFRCEGYGKTRPLGPNTTEENRRQNRRIEMKIL